MKTFSVLLSSSLFFSLTAFAGDLEVKEIFSIVAGTSAEASTLFDQQCNQWKADIKAQLGAKALYLSCGSKTMGEAITQTASSEDVQYYDQNGNLVSDTVTNYKPAGTYAFVAKSDSSILLTSDSEIKNISEKLASSGSKCKVGQKAECLAVRLAARKSFAAECTRFKTDAAASFGAKLIYASCGVFTNSDATSSGNEFLYSSTGTIYYQ